MRKNIRTVAAIAAAVLAVAAVSASGEEDTASSSDKNPDGVTAGLGSKDASADVTAPQIISEGEAPFTIKYASATITNNSEKRSDYFITIAVESADGATKYEDTIISVMNLEPGQSVQEKGILTTEELPADAVVSIKEVQRTAST